MDDHRARPQGRVVSIEVENFKSYRGRQEIGPFHSFTAVIGPNGSGKSNLMDAISFVLGVKTAQLRGSLKELLYSNTDRITEEDRPKRGHVKLVFETDEGDLVHFCHSIMPSSAGSDQYSSQYRLDNRVVTWTAYDAKLHSFGILVKARNFLVFQGDIESVAGMSPMGLTAMFENVSGSDAFKKDYEELEAKKNEAEEHTTFIFSKKKTVMADLKQKKEQKQEAEKHLKMQKELEDLKAQFYLWQLFHHQQDSARAEKELAAQREELEAAARELHATEKQLEAKKKAQAALKKQQLLLEQKIKKRRAEVEKKNPNNALLKEEMRRLVKRVKAEEKAVEEAEKKKAEQDEMLAKLEEDLKRIEDDQKSQEATTSRELLQGTTEADFFKIQEETGAKTARSKTERDTLQEAQTTDRQALENKKEMLASMTGRMEELHSQREGASQQKVERTRALQEARTQLKAKQAEISALTDSNRKARAQREQLERKREQLEEKLRSMQVDRHESEKERISKEIEHLLKRTFPGVKGRVCNLGQLSQRRHNLAMEVVMNKTADALVVDNDRTGKDCIGLLKQRRLREQTFIPLATVKVKAVAERLRHLGGTAKLALDLLVFDRHLEPAFLHACGSTLVCETVEEARRLAFAGQERHKVVALDGTLFQKSGAITGGSMAERDRTGRFDKAAAHNLREDLKRLEAELAAMPSDRENLESLQKLQSEVSGLQRDIELLQAEARADQEQRTDVEAATLQTECERLEPLIAQLQADVDVRQAKIDALEAKINEVVDRIFAAFSKKVGVPNIRQYMKEQEDAQMQRRKRNLELSRQHGKVSSQLSYERKSRKTLAAALVQKRASLKEAKERLAELEEQDRVANSAAEEVEQELASQMEKVEKLKQQTEEADAELKALKKTEAAQAEAGIKCRRGMQGTEATLETLSAKRADILQTAQLEQVTLPQLEDNGDAMDTDEIDDDDDQPAAKLGRLNFGQLTRQQKAATTTAERERLEAEYKGDIELRAATLARLAPNLKALEQFGVAKEKEKEQNEELKAARQESKKAADAFEAVRLKRQDAFMAAFDHISNVIDHIYKDLTCSQVHQRGGAAYLSLELADNPFLGGIKFTAMPPTKRFQEMELLSGGEKTLSALALLFAVHSYKPSPFFVLDEIDAALDATNVSRVARYIRAKTRSDDREPEFQAVVISLKDNFFSKADALVGVTRDPHSGCSATFTLDLNQFPE